MVGDNPELDQAAADLGWLSAHGALAGVAEILRERRRQIEAHGYTGDHDDAHDDGSVAAEAMRRLGHLLYSRIAGISDCALDEDKLRTAGAQPPPRSTAYSGC